MTRRSVQLLVGLALYGLGIALQVASGLGNAPWDVLHEGLALRSGLSIGWWIVIAGALVMLLWIPLRQRPGIGTVGNVILVGVFTDLFLWMLPEPSSLPLQAILLVASLVVGGVATACYIGAGLGPGPRDGLMTGLTARTGLSLRGVRTGIEVTVLACGWLLGGTVGAGTVAYALLIGPLTQLFLPRFTLPAASARRPEAVPSGEDAPGRDVRPRP